jgi:carbamoylphosphate synthase large subunit
MSYKNILIGINTFSNNWITALRQIKETNIILIDFCNSELLNSTIDKHHIDYIMPLSEKDYLIIKNKNYDYNKILYPNSETFNLLNNKLLFTEFMMTHFLDNIPKVYYIDNKQLAEIEYPVISKPIYSTNGINMNIYHNNIELETCKNKIIIQKFIDYEYEYGAHMLCINGTIINWKIIRFKYPKYTIKRDNFPNNYENIVNFEVKLFQPIITKLNYTGGICIDFKFDTSTNNIYIFEINPRFGGSAFSNNFIYELLCIN